MSYTEINAVYLPAKFFTTFQDKVQAQNTNREGLVFSLLCLPGNNGSLVVPTEHTLQEEGRIPFITITGN